MIYNFNPIIYQDTREHEPYKSKLKKQFSKNGYEVINQALEVGDYMLASNPSYVIDRKLNLDELMSNLKTKDHARFRREFERAEKKGIRIDVLCSHGNSVKELEDVKSFKSEYTRVTGKNLYQTMKTFEENHNTKFYFCNKKNIGNKIIELLEKGAGTI